MRCLIFVAVCVLAVAAIAPSQIAAQSAEDLAALNQQVGTLYQQGKYAEAIPIAERYIAAAENAHGEEHVEYAAAIVWLGVLYKYQGRYAEAEPLYQRGLAIFEKALGPEHAHVGKSLHNLAHLYKDQGRYAEAEPLYQRALAIFEKAVGKDDPDFAASLNNLAALYSSMSRYAEAEPLLKRSLAIKEKALGKDHRDVGTSLNNLAEFYNAQGRYVEAEPLLKRSLAIKEKALGPDHPDVGTSLSNLAGLYNIMSRYAEAEPLYKRALAIREKALGPEHPDVGALLNGLGWFYKSQGRYAEAEPLYKRGLAIVEKALGPDSTEVGTSLKFLAVLYNIMSRYAEAEPLLKRSLAIKEKALGPMHTNVGAVLNDLAVLYKSQGRYQEAEPLYKRSLAIAEKAFGPDHPSVATSLNNLALLYRAMARPDEAAVLEQRSAAMPKPGTRELTVYFVTNRAAQPGEKPLSFGSVRSRTLNFGKARIVLTSEELRRLAERRVEGLGRLHQAGGRLTSAEKLTIRSNARLNTSKDLIAAAADVMQRSSLYKNQALIFVHGFNVSFEDAILRASQMAFDLEFDGALMPFSWPSAGKWFSYKRDRKSADAAVEHLVDMIDLVSEKMPSTRLHFLAHSMGNIVLLGALKRIAERPGTESNANFGEVVLAHPDVGSEQFEKLAAAIEPLGIRLTLYTNSADWALWISELINGTGRVGSDVLVVPGVDTIDTSGMEAHSAQTSIGWAKRGFNHNVFVRNPILFGEITRLLLTNQRPVHERTSEFQPVKATRGGSYWKFKPAPLASGN